MGSLLDMIDEEASKKESEPTILTLGDLVREARKAEIKPGKFDGHEFYTIVVEDGRMWVETTSKAEYDAVMAKRGK